MQYLHWCSYIDKLVEIHGVLWEHNDTTVRCGEISIDDLSRGMNVDAVPGMALSPVLGIWIANAHHGCMLASVCP